MDEVWVDYVPWIYASIQAAITLVVSIMGVIFVRKEFLLQKNRQQQPLELQINVVNKNSAEDATKNDNTSNENTEQQTENQEQENDIVQPLPSHNNEYKVLWDSSST